MRKTLFSLPLVLMMFSGCQGDSSPLDRTSTSLSEWASKTCHERYRKNSDLSTHAGIQALEAACRDGVAQVAPHLKEKQGPVAEHSQSLQQCEQVCADSYKEGVDQTLDAQNKIDQQEIASPSLALPEGDGESVEQIDAETAEERAAKPKIQKVTDAVLDVGEITQACSESCADEWIRISKPPMKPTALDCVESIGPGGITRCY